MRRLLTTCLALACIASASAAQAQAAQDIAAQDMRLARTAEAMQQANVRLCRQTMPVTGMILHSADQYGEGAETLFANGDLAIAAVVPGSPAERAGLRANDGIVGIAGREVAVMRASGEDHLREVAFFDLASLPEGSAVNIVVSREGEQSAISFAAPRGCLSLVEILLADGPDARSDGQIIQLQYAFAERLDDDQLAVVLAHELAHAILEHRLRKEAAGIDNESIMRHLGRNRQANRQAEVEADRLSVHLLANAGYDPMISAQFWRSDMGREAGGSAFPSPIYPTQESRAAMLEREIAMYLPLRRGPTWPGHLIALRDRSFAAD